MHAFFPSAAPKGLEPGGRGGGVRMEGEHVQANRRASCGKGCPKNLLPLGLVLNAQSASKCTHRAHEASAHQARHDQHGAKGARVVGGVITGANDLGKLRKQRVCVWGGGGTH